MFSCIYNRFSIYSKVWILVYYKNVRYLFILIDSGIFLHSKLKTQCSKVFFNDITKKNFVFFNLVQEFIEIKSWLLLTFFASLHNQLSSIHSISNIKEYRCLNKIIHQIESEWTVASFSNFCGKIWVGFCQENSLP